MANAKRKHPTNWNEVPIIFDLPYAARIVELSVDCLKKRAAAGTFPAYKEGKDWRVRKTALMEHVGEPISTLTPDALARLTEVLERLAGQLSAEAKEGTTCSP